MSEKMNRNILIVLLLLFAFLSGCLQQDFEFEKDEVKFYSTEAEPMELLKEFSSAKLIIAEAELSISDQKANVSTFNNALIPFYTVAAGNDTNAIQFLVFKDSAIVDCQTNFGNLTTQEFLTKEECAVLQNDWSNEKTVVFLQPDPNALKAGVRLTANRAEIVSRTSEEQAIIASVLTNVIYPNAEIVLRKSQEKLEQLN